eukprot:gnl/MRDRNA2_/MRDRNA2_86859_c0_seq1.p1 gnl/MRDRNA2_/MRDRNA2_86859_c0~~gnl/MRDRNA2_/MRDRNA2_86859_c0_seq1.p1  ORF type:complete len:418 (+),score=146.42 gnl/MRDRNA2_/MRDRNA2_86859_c0_seq1:113-1366(+)
MAPKRSADSKLLASKRTKKIVTPVEKRVNTIMNALASVGPESCRSMLVAAAPIALKVPKDERHADQEEVFAMLKEIFDADKTRWQSRVADANSVLESAVAEQTEKDTLKDDANAAVKAQKEVVRSKVEAQCNADDLVKDCKETYASAVSMYESCERTRDALAEEQKNGLALADAIKGLKEGSIENPKECKKHIEKVTKLVQSRGADEALVKTLPQILRRKPEERGNFDEMALQQLDECMKDHLHSLASKLDDAEKDQTEHQTAVTAWTAGIQVAEDKKKECDDAFDAASAQEAELQMQLNNARKILKEQGAVVKRKKSDLATEECGLQCAEEVLEALEFLQEYVTPAPEPEASMDDVAKEPEEVAVDVPAEVDAVAASVVPSTKVKEIDVAMDFDDVPSPAKRARVSLGGAAPTLVA